jgi:hypothetical protein
MATTATIVYVGRNRLRYLVSYSGAGATSVVLTTTGGATPDIITDSIGGLIKRIAQAFANGYGPFAAGALTQAQARELWLSDFGAAPGAALIPAFARCIITPRANTIAQAWGVDANVDGSGHPTITASMLGTPGTASDVYLDIEVPHQIGG